MRGGAFFNGKEGRVDFRKNTIMPDKEVLVRILSMLPEEFQDITMIRYRRQRRYARRWERRFLPSSPIPALC